LLTLPVLLYDRRGDQPRSCTGPTRSASVILANSRRSERPPTWFEFGRPTGTPGWERAAVSRRSVRPQPHRRHEKHRARDRPLREAQREDCEKSSPGTRPRPGRRWGRQASDPTAVEYLSAPPATWRSTRAAAWSRSDARVRARHGQVDDRLFMHAAPHILA